MQRSKAGARAFRRRHSDDHEVRGLVGLQFLPVARPPRAVLRIRAFRHDALEAHALDFVVEEDAFLGDVIDEAQRTGPRKDVAQKALSFEQRQRAQVEILEGQDVEGLQGRGKSHRGRGHVRGASQLRPLLQSREARTSVVVEADEFAVEDQAREGQERRGARDLGIKLGGLAAPAIDEFALPVFDDHEQAIAVVLEFVDEVGIGERPFRVLREHEVG